MLCLGIVPYLTGEANRFGPALETLNGVPLYTISVDCAFASSLCDRVIVLTDDGEMQTDCLNRYGGRVEVIAVSREERALLETRGDLYEFAFQRFSEAEYAGLFFPKYPLRNVERIRQDIAPHLHFGRLYSTLSFGDRSVSTFDLWMEIDGGWTPVCSGQEQFLSPLNEAYLFAAKGYHYEGLSEMSHMRNEGVLFVTCMGNECFEVLDEKQAEYAGEILSGQEKTESALESKTTGDCLVVAPKGKHGVFSNAMTRSGASAAEEQWLVLEDADVDIAVFRFYDLQVAREFMHPAAYRRLCNDSRRLNSPALRFGLQSSRYRIASYEFQDMQSRLAGPERYPEDPLWIPASRVVHEYHLAFEKEKQDVKGKTECV